MHFQGRALVLEDNGYALVLHVEEAGSSDLHAHFGPTLDFGPASDFAEAVVGCLGLLRHADGEHHGRARKNDGKES